MYDYARLACRTAVPLLCDLVALEATAVSPVGLLNPLALVILQHNSLWTILPGCIRRRGETARPSLGWIGLGPTSILANPFPERCPFFILCQFINHNVKLGTILNVLAESTISMLSIEPGRIGARVVYRACWGVVCVQLACVKFKRFKTDVVYHRDASLLLLHRGSFRTKPYVPWYQDVAMWHDAAFPIDTAAWEFCMPQLIFGCPNIRWVAHPKLRQLSQLFTAWVYWAQNYRAVAMAFLR